MSTNVEKIRRYYDENQQLILEVVNGADAENVDFDNAGTGLASDNVQDALAEVSNMAKTSVDVSSQYADEVIRVVNKAKSLSDEPCLTFAAITDIHYDYNGNTDPPPAASKKVFDESVRNMKAVALRTRMDAVISMGDMIDGNVSKATGRKQAAHMVSQFLSVERPFYIALGNHDNNMDGYSTPTNTDYFTRAEMREIFMDFMDDAEFCSDGYKTDFYKDFDRFKIRLIVIYGNSGTYSGGKPGDYSFGDDTRAFLYTSLDTLPTGYKAIVITHVPPIANWLYSNKATTGGESGSTTVNGTTINGGVKGIINAFADDVIVMFYGHSHEDNVWATPYNGIGICCNRSTANNGTVGFWRENGYMPSRSSSDKTADLWDFVMVKPVSKVIELIRFGAGCDRTLHYEPIECAAGSSVTLTPRNASGGNWGVRTSDGESISVSAGVASISAGATVGTLLQVFYTDRSLTDVASKTWNGGSYMEYRTIKVVAAS